MSKRRSWLDFVKRIFSSDSKSKQEKKEKRKRWLFGKLKPKRSPALTAPPPPPSSMARTLKAAEEEQSKHAMAVAVASAAAAEAAVAAAQAAAEVVRLTATPISYQNYRDVDAAVKIQTAFRGYLARRALRALKGLVRLQALVRGRAVRRQTNIALKNLQSLIKIQTQARANRLRMSQELQAREARDRLRRKTKQLEEQNAEKQRNGKTWDGSSLSKEEINALFIYRQEAAFKRERALEYASSRQGRRSVRRHSLPAEKVSEETEKPNRRWSWLEHWVETQPWEKDIQEILPVPVPSPDQDTHDHPHSSTLMTNIDSTQRNKEEHEFRPMMRRSFNRSRRSYVRDDESFSSSPAFPSYMAFTESAKARSRSISTPKQRHGSTTDIFPDSCTLQSSRLQSPFTSVCSDASLMKLGKLQLLNHHHHQKSPRVTGSPGRMKSRSLRASTDVKVS